jgi:tripartite ATP-independent transporter DctM subunit
MQWYDVVIWVTLFFVLLFTRTKIAITLGLTGIIGLALANRFDLHRVLSTIAYNNMDSFTLTAIPLFVFMANIIEHSGIGVRFYKGISPWFSHIPGGLAQSSLFGCAIFSATMGSSVSVAATMGMVAIPEMRRRGYHTRMIVGPLAAGGTLGILIPPSLAMIVYGAATEQSIGKLFIAGLIPGIILAALYMIIAGVISKMHPEWVPKQEPVSFRKSLLPGLRDGLPVIGIIFIIVGGIYSGLMTPTESAAVAAFATLLIAGAYGGLNWKTLERSLMGTVAVTGMILLLVIGAQFMAYALQIANVSRNMIGFMAGLPLPPWAIFIAICIFYGILGCFFDGLSMVLITIPLIYPIIIHLGFDPIWFGVILTILVELGQLTPPVGINLFVIQGVSGCPLGDIVKGSMPYWVAIVAALIIVTLFPALATWLPSRMG